MDRDLATGDNYYWNMETQESSWSLPPCRDVAPWGRGALAAGQGKGSGKGRRWREGGKHGGGWWEEDDSWSEQWSPAEASSSAWLPRETDSSIREEPGSAADVADAAKRLRDRLAGVSGVREVSAEEVERLLAGEAATEAPGLLMLFESDDERPAEDLFPSDFNVVEPLGATDVSAGYLLVDIRGYAGELDDSMARCARCWWALAQATDRFSTVVFLLAPSAALDAEGCDAFGKLHREVAFRSPTPLVFACARGGIARGGSRGSNGAHRRAAHAAASAASAAGAPTLEDEEELVKEIATFLESGPREVQELASSFAQRFNTTVRCRPDSPYCKDGKNDGSFKRWLISRGFQAGVIFEYNKSMISLPEGGASTLPKVVKSSSSKASSSAPPSPRAGAKSSSAPAPSTPPRPASPFKPPHGSGTPEAKQLEAEVLEHLDSNGLTDMGSLRQVNDLGARFNTLFFQRSKVNDGSWKRWLASIADVEVVTDPARASYHGNQPTMVRRRAEKGD